MQYTMQDKPCWGFGPATYPDAKTRLEQLGRDEVLRRTRVMKMVRRAVKAAGLDETVLCEMVTLHRRSGSTVCRKNRILAECFDGRKTDQQAVELALRNYPPKTS